MNERSVIKTGSISMIAIWLAVFALVPLLMMVIVALLRHSANHFFIWKLTLQNFRALFSPIFFTIFFRSLWFSTLCTAFTLLIGYPAALFISRKSKVKRWLLMLLMILPFWTSSLVRTYAIMVILKAKGLLNSLLIWLGVIHQPMQLLFSHTAVLIGAVYTLLPFMVLPLYINLEKMDTRLYDAARDLGASDWRILWKITVPLTMPGIISGVLFVSLPAMTLFYIPDLLGGAKSLLLGNLIENQFLSMNDWPGGCASSVVLTVIMFGLIAVYRHFSQGRGDVE